MVCHIEIALTDMRRRGPDARAVERIDLGENCLVLGHARLSIIDLSEDGTQPMWSRDRRISIVFNGEIYNYIELRQELMRLGHHFDTRTDTEVLIAAWRQWDIRCLDRLEGMFAFAIYDAASAKLTCVRDAFGIKPFFFSHGPDHFLFASDPGAIRALSATPLQIDWQRAYDYLVHGDYDSTERSFFAGVRHLRPAHYLELDLCSGAVSGPHTWWQPKIGLTAKVGIEQAAEQFRELFLDSVRMQLRSDVPIGAALSGGLDSSSIVCAMRSLEPDLDLKTFSYISADALQSEESWIDCVNDYCQADSRKVYCGENDIIGDLDDLVVTQGEPMGGTSYYAQYRVYRAAKEAGVTVTLDGQGADELLGGYSGYPGPRFRSIADERGFWAASSFIRDWASWPGRSIPQGMMYASAEYADGALYEKMRAIYGRASVPKWLNQEFMESKGVATRQPRYGMANVKHGRHMISAMASAIRHRGLPALLRHGDRNSMRFSVESRVPFLTTRMCDFLYSLPEEYLVSERGETKRLLRIAMRGIVPDRLLDRRDKIGFATPQQGWVTSPAIKEKVRQAYETCADFINADEIAWKKNAGKEHGRLSVIEWRILNFGVWAKNVMGLP